MMKSIINHFESKRESPGFLYQRALAAKYFLADRAIPSAAAWSGGLRRRLNLLVQSVSGYRHRKPKIRKNAASFRKVSFCTTCMNREHHFKKTFPKNFRHNIQYPNVEFVVVDYNSRGDVSAWLVKHYSKHMESGQIRIFRTELPQKFHMSHAKNLAHFNATGDVLCNLDADNYTGRDFAYYLNERFQKDDSIVVCNKLHILEKLKSPAQKASFWSKLLRPKHGIGGRIAISSKNFDALGGYDEAFKDWGCEDNDFFVRALNMGLTFEPCPLYFMKILASSNFGGKKYDSESAFKRNRRLFQVTLGQKRSQPRSGHRAVELTRIGTEA